MQGVYRYGVTLAAHDEAWTDEFKRTAALLRQAWGDAVLDVQHIGSTAIRGICAKPILDVGVVLRSLEEVDTAALTARGYEFRGQEAPDDDRLLFVLRAEGEVTLQLIHCYGPDSPDLRRCMAFRDHLNACPEEARRYDALKRELAARYADDRRSYTAGKAEYIKSIYEKLGL